MALKKLHLTDLTDKAKNEFFKELSIMHSIRYLHIINLYGACTETGKYALVMEYMSLGSLYKVLHEDELALEWAEKLSIASQTAKGINYLHQLQQPILHRDIKSLNFLLERIHQGYHVKLCDFGLARVRTETSRQTSSNLTLSYTLQWTAPEILRLKNYTDRSDIYSLGIVYWELAARKIPYDGFQDSVIRLSILDGERLQIPETTPPTFCKLIEQCWAQDPNDRPKSSDLIKMIEECVQSQSNSLILLFGLKMWMVMN